LLSIFIASLLFLCPYGFANDGVRIDWPSLSLSERAAVTNALIIDKIEYQDTPLVDALKDLSRRSRSALGGSFSIFDKNASKGRLAMPVTLRAENITIRDVLKYLGTAVDATIVLTEHACVISDKEDAKKEP
jgi:hypothetical protein